MACLGEGLCAPNAPSLVHCYRWALCGLWGCKNWPAPFPGRMSYNTTKPGLALFVVYLSMFYCIVVYYGPFCCIVSFRCYVFCLLVVLVELSVLAKWLARKTPLRKSNRGKGIISRKPRPKSAQKFSWFIVLLHCFIMYLCSLLLLHDILSYCYGAI